MIASMPHPQIRIVQQVEERRALEPLPLIAETR
jgi:hypothetical protein